MAENQHSASARPAPERPEKPGARRYRRYKTVIDFVFSMPSFGLLQAKQAIADQPAFITRLVRDLESNGWIVRESGGEELYRWNPGRGEFSPEKWLDEKLFGSQVKLAPAEQRPRERLLADGAQSLTVAQLLAILIRSGRPGESAVMAGESIARAFQHRLHDLPSAGRGELKELTPAVESTAYCQIMAGIELGRRIAGEAGNRRPQRITSTGAAIEFCQQHFLRLACDGVQEEFHIVTLDTRNQVIDTHCITVGTLDASLVHPREVFRAAIRDAAQSVILVHNHPSGDPHPSREDHSVTRRLEQAGETIGIKVLDHVVVGRNGCCSLRESGA